VRYLVDTSALYALLDEDEARHRQAAATFERLVRAGVDLLTHDYVIIEACALVHRRLGFEAAQRLLTRIVPVLDVRAIDRPTCDAAIAAYTASSGNTSLVDRASFELMRRADIDTAFAFDADFEHEGFRLVP
jgi:predicted nucleic acid-binding protein